MNRAICFILLMFISACQSSDQSTPNGDLDSTFMNGEVLLPEPDTSKNTGSGQLLATPDSVFMLEKQALLDAGWVESTVPNGQLPVCYNFTPRRGDIDNRLEIQVGGGTDVALKLMDMKSDRCIRYVYINSGTTFTIKNVPEGKYYVKIAYGKEWLSKTDDGKCIGKFIRNAMYKRGEDVMDFQLQYNSDGYSIPSFRLELDVISMNSIETFSSKGITQEEFNK